jgi:NAD(P)-dependent dehydrogenase (short-subunit alcohol dehydrogenase family)
MGVLQGKTAVVAGGTSGIGACISGLFAAEGATVFISGRRTKEGSALARKLGADAYFVRADVTDEADVQHLIDQATTRSGRLDCLVNCAGEGGTPGGIATLDPELLKRTFAVHVAGTALGMKHAAPIMTSQGSGSIVNIASIGGHVGGWTFLDYSAAKAAVINLTRCVAVELGECGVRVNSISPGPILTGIFAKGAGIDPAEADRTAASLDPVFTERLESWQPIRRAGVPNDVAPAALWLASDASSFVNGQDLAVDGGILSGRPASVSTADRAAMALVLLGTQGAS